MDKDFFNVKMNYVASNIRSLSAIVMENDNASIKADLDMWNELFDGQIMYLKRLQDELNKAMD